MTLRVVAAIIRRDNQIFATQRGYGDFKGGWEFPGGKMEPGETLEAALMREITLLEHEASRWLSKGELYSVEWLPADVGIIPFVEEVL